MASASRPPRHELWELCQEVAKAGLATKLLFVHIPEVEAAFQGLQSVVQHLKATSTCDLSTSAALAAIVLHGVRGKDGVTWCAEELLSRLHLLGDVGVGGWDELRRLTGARIMAIFVYFPNTSFVLSS